MDDFMLATWNPRPINVFKSNPRRVEHVNAWTSLCSTWCHTHIKCSLGFRWMVLISLTAYDKLWCNDTKTWHKWWHLIHTTKGNLASYSRNALHSNIHFQLMYLCVIIALGSCGRSNTWYNKPVAFIVCHIHTISTWYYQVFSFLWMAWTE